MRKPTTNKRRGNSNRVMLAAAVLGLAAFAGAPASHDVYAGEAAMAAPDCSDGYPRLGCKIWKVTVEASVSISPKGTIKCETTDKWICMRDLF